MGGIVTFGKKHFGKSLPQIVLQDADWFFWAIDDDVFDRHPRFLPEASELASKARNIKIPRPNPQEWRVEYIVTHDGKFADFNIVEATSRERDEGWTFRRDRIDLSVPRQFKEYDKRGCSLMLKKLKYYYFGSKTDRLTKEKCEEFFANPHNFLPPTSRKPLVQPNPFAKPNEISTLEPFFKT